MTSSLRCARWRGSLLRSSALRAECILLLYVRGFLRHTLFSSTSQYEYHHPGECGRKSPALSPPLVPHPSAPHPTRFTSGASADSQPPLTTRQRARRALAASTPALALPRITRLPHESAPIPAAPDATGIASLGAPSGLAASSWYKAAERERHEAASRRRRPRRRRPIPLLRLLPSVIRPTEISQDVGRRSSWLPSESFQCVYDVSPYRCRPATSEDASTRFPLDSLDTTLAQTARWSNPADAHRGQPPTLAFSPRQSGSPRPLPPRPHASPLPPARLALKAHAPLALPPPAPHLPPRADAPAAAPRVLALPPPHRRPRGGSSPTGGTGLRHRPLGGWLPSPPHGQAVWGV